MTGTATNLIMGVGELYIAPFGETEPADIGVTPAGNWVDVGYTSGGVTLLYTPTYQELVVDQITDILARRITKREFNLRTNLSEATLQNFYDVGMSGNAEEGGAGLVAVTGPPTADEVEAVADHGPEQQVTGQAVLFDGFAPGFSSGAHFRRRVTVRKVVNVAPAETSATRDSVAMLPCDFSAMYVDGTISPWKVEDAD
jgi:hypothetical protein